MPSRSSLKHHRETQIAQAAYEIIAENGYENITVHDIATRAGFSKGVVYYYFESKDDVMVFLFHSIISVINGRFAEIRQSNPEPERQLEKLVRSSLDIVHDHIEFYRVLMVFWGQINHKGYISAINKKLFSYWRSEIKKIVEMGIGQGVFRTEVNPSMTASSIITKVLGTSLQYIFDENAFVFKEMVDHIINEVMITILVTEK